MTDKELLQRFDRVYHSVDRAAATAGRQAEDITLVAVSKKHPAQMVATVAAHWSRIAQPVFGESYAQEALGKQREVHALLLREARPCSLHWHFIGHIQSKKCRDLAGAFALIHSVASEKIASSLDAAWKTGAFAAGDRSGPAAQSVLVQVNIGREPQKSGVLPEEAHDLVAMAGALPHLRLEGLMCIPPATDSPAGARAYFSALRELRDTIAKSTGQALPHLSMGMSGDYAEAIAEGATLVRIGSDIFGARDA